MISIWSDFVNRFDCDQNWDLCDLFADIGCSIFDFYIAEKIAISKGQKAKQYQHILSPIKEILVKPQFGAQGYYANTANTWVQCSYTHHEDVFYFVDLYDFDISIESRQFKYVLCQNVKFQYFIFEYTNLKFYLLRDEKENIVDRIPNKSYPFEQYCNDEL